MSLFLLAARLLLALVFAVAALTKLADLAGSRKALASFGVPEALAGAGGVLLPLAELAVAIALIPTASAWAAAIAAGVLLCLFICGIAYNLARGRQPDCHCFGQLYSEPVGWSTLLRNALLVAIAGFVIWQGRQSTGTSAVAWLQRWTAPEQVLLALAILAGVLALLSLWLVLQLITQNGRLLLRLEALEAGGANGIPQPALASTAPPAGLPVGAPAPSFGLSGIHGETLTLEALRSSGRPVLLTFTDPQCGPCSALLPDLARWQRELAPMLSLVLISRGSLEENRAKGAEYGLTQVLLQKGRTVSDTYQAPGTPSAVLVQADGRIGSPLAQGGEEIRALVARIAGGAAPAAAPVAPGPAGLIPLPVLPSANGAAPCPHCGQVHGHAHEAPQSAPAPPQGLPLGSPAPELRLPDLEGRTVDLADFRGRSTLVLFWSPGCGFCQQLIPELKAWESNRPAGAPALLIVSTGGAPANRAQGLASTILLEQSFQTGSRFGASGTPSAVLVGADGSVASPLAVGGPAVMTLARGEALPAAEAPAPSQPPVAVAGIGQPAPAVSLPDLDGQTRTLAEFRSRPTILLFWNPDCGFCQSMLPDLKRWEAKPPKRARQLVVISTGTVEANRALGLRSPLLLDEGFQTASSFGASGTPSAVLIDTQGQVASSVVVGAPSVLELARHSA